MSIFENLLQGIIYFVNKISHDKGAACAQTRSGNRSIVYITIGQNDLNAG